MTQSPLLAIDTLDDRREVYHLLHRLSPRARVRFLERCCARVRAARGGTGPAPTPGTAAGVPAAYRCGRADDRLTAEVYGDLLALAANWGLDLLAVAAELEALAKGRAVGPVTGP